MVKVKFLMEKCPVKNLGYSQRLLDQNLHVSSIHYSCVSNRQHVQCTMSGKTLHVTDVSSCMSVGEHGECGTTVEDGTRQWRSHLDVVPAVTVWPPLHLNYLARAQPSPGTKTSPSHTMKGLTWAFCNRSVCLHSLLQRIRNDTPDKTCKTAPCLSYHDTDRPVSTPYFKDC